MGALGHFLENRGIATTQISLIKEHTRIIRPPRALWVPFDLGRPLGAANNPDFQRRVLRAALELLVAPEGPILVDFPGDAPADSEAGLNGWACPIAGLTKPDDKIPLARLYENFKREVSQLRPWYDLGVERRGRTAVAYFSPDAAGSFLQAFASGPIPPSPLEDVPTASALRLAAQDIKAFYYEAVAARPGASPPMGAVFSRWFWQETAAGSVLKKIRERCLREEDPELRKTAALLLVPADQS